MHTHVHTIDADYCRGETNIDFKLKLIESNVAHLKNSWGCKCNG